MLPTGAVAVLGLCAWGQAVPPDVEWTRHIDTPYGDWILSLESTGGDYIMTGEVYTADSASAVDVLLAKVDSDGRAIWSTRINAGPGKADSGIRVRETVDGGYIVVGTSREVIEGGSYSSGYVIRTDRDGDVVWDKLYETFPVGIDIIERDNGFLILGIINANLLGLRQQLTLVAIDQQGEVMWQKMHGGDGNEHTFAMVKAKDGYLIVGTTGSFPDGDVNERPYLLKIDEEGDPVWEKLLPRPAFEPHAILPALGGGFYVAGDATLKVEGRNNSQHWLAKVDDVGEPLWYAITGGVYGDGALDLSLAPDGGVILAGYTETEPSFVDAHIVKVTPGGEIAWELTLENTGWAEGIRLTQDGGYLVAGVGGPTNPDDVRDDSSIFLIKLKPEDLPGFRFRRGDANRDGEVNVADAVTLLGHLFLGEGALPCPDAGDADDNGVLSIADAVHVLNHLFKSGPPIRPPFPADGVDLTLDLLGCAGP